MIAYNNSKVYIILEDKDIDYIETLRNGLIDLLYCQNEDFIINKIFELKTILSFMQELNQVQTITQNGANKNKTD